MLFRNKKHRLLLVGLVVIGLVIGTSLAVSSLRAQQEPYVNGRFGFGLTKPASTAQSYGWPSFLNAGWYWDWLAKGDTQLPPLKYVQTIRLSPVKSDGVQIGYTASPTGTALLAAITEQPGTTWFIGNEPDCTLMDDMRSEWYARAYHDLYHIIKAADPTTTIAAGNIVQPTPQRLTYLDRVLNTYETTYGESLPADAWVIHSYILCERCYPFNIPSEPFAWGACFVPDWPSRGASDHISTFYSVEDHWDVNVFSQRIVDFRQWMYDNGYRNHPLVIAEYGILFYEGLVYSNPTYNIKNEEFMVEGFDWMREARDPVLGYKLDDNRLVQRWAWFSLDHGNYPGGTLFDPYVYEPTELGIAYADYTSQILPTIDLMTFDVTVITPTSVMSSPVTATVKLTVSNAGNVNTEGSILAKLIANSPTSPTLYTPVGGATTGRPLECCGDHETITFTWPNYYPGESYDYYITALDIDLHVSDVWTPMQDGVITPTTATLTATLSNHGYSNIGEPVTMTFYHKTTSMMPVAETVIPTLGCCGDEQTVSATWLNVTDGVYAFCAIASTTFLETEPGCAYLWVNPQYKVYLPFVAKE